MSVDSHMNFQNKDEQMFSLEYLPDFTANRYNFN
jgi:hypothetical protein